MTVLREEVEGQTFNRNQTVRIGHVSGGLMPEVPALVRNPLMQFCNLPGRFPSPFAPLLAPGKPTLGNAQLAEAPPHPARVINRRAVRQGQEAFK